MNIAQIKETLTSSGWIEDNYGNFKSVSGKVRVHFKKTSITVERVYYKEPSEYNPKPSKEWMKVCSSYMKDLKVTEGRLIVNGRALKVQGE